MNYFNGLFYIRMHAMVCALIYCAALKAIEILYFTIRVKGIYYSPSVYDLFKKFARRVVRNKLEKYSRTIKVKYWMRHKYE